MIISYGEGTKVLLNHAGNLAYSSNQVEGLMTLDDLLKAVEEAVEEFGSEAEVVLFQTNNGRGANYGQLSRWETFSPAEKDEEL